MSGKGEQQLQLLVWATAGAGAAAALYWAGKKAIDNYVPYEVRGSSTAGWGASISGWLRWQQRARRAANRRRPASAAAARSTTTAPAPSLAGWRKCWTSTRSGGGVSGAPVQMLLQSIRTSMAC